MTEAAAGVEYFPAGVETLGPDDVVIGTGVEVFAPEPVDDDADVVDIVAGAVAESMLGAAPLRFIQSRARSATRQARDDVGRWRKIYYRLRRSQSSEAKVRKALKLVKDAEWHSQLGQMKPHQKIEKVRREVKDLGLTEEIDERVSAKLIKDAKDAANMVRRLEVLGRGTMVSISQLPQEMQDAIKEYLRQTNLEPRITKHFGPFRQGKVKRSVADIINLIDRTVVDNQQYTKGYDLERS